MLLPKTESSVPISHIAAQMQASEAAAYEREVQASLRRGVAQALDPLSPKLTLSELDKKLAIAIALSAESKQAMA